MFLITIPIDPSTPQVSGSNFEYQCKKQICRYPFSTGFPFEDRDFNSTQVLITFPAGNAGIQTIDIGIVDDDINEVEQVFVIFLQVVDAVDTARVDLQFGRFATQGRILDDDRKSGSGLLIFFAFVWGCQYSEKNFIYITFMIIFGKRGAVYVMQY